MSDVENVSQEMIPASPEEAVFVSGGDKLPAEQRRRLLGFFGFLVLLTGAFMIPLIALAKHALAEELHSHLLLIPAVTAYLIHLKWGELPRLFRLSAVPGLLFLIGAVSALAAALMNEASFSHNDYLALMVVSYLCFGISGAFLFLGRGVVGAIVFPIAFLVFMIPLPDGIVDQLETASQYASAEVSDWVFQAFGDANVPRSECISDSRDHY